MHPNYAPKEVFEQILKWAVIPTFDLVIEHGNKGVILVKRTIAPYQNQWALPGLRMFKGENIDDTLKRIAQQELGIEINIDNKQFLAQFVGKFKTEQDRQDISSGYVVKINEEQELKLNPEHFSTMMLVNSIDEIPKNIGAMYKFYLTKYFELKEK
jgi:ADP-ribose pyrophosphatase YjhB (NUDIX family)